MSIYRRALAYYRPFLGPTIVAVLLTLVSIALGVLRPWPFSFNLNHVKPAAGKDALGLYLAGFVLGNWSLPAIVALMCALAVAFLLISGFLTLVTGVIFLRVSCRRCCGLRTGDLRIPALASPQVSRPAAKRRFEFPGGVRFAVDPDILQQGHLHLSVHVFHRQHVHR